MIASTPLRDGMVKDVNGKILPDDVQVKRRWAEYFEDGVHVRRRWAEYFEDGVQVRRRWAEYFEDGVPERRRWAEYFEQVLIVEDVKEANKRIIIIIIVSFLQATLREFRSCRFEKK